MFRPFGKGVDALQATPVDAELPNDSANFRVKGQRTILVKQRSIETNFQIDLTFHGKYHTRLVIGNSSQ